MHQWYHRDAPFLLRYSKIKSNRFDFTTVRMIWGVHQIRESGEAFPWDSATSLGDETPKSIFGPQHDRNKFTPPERRIKFFFLRVGFCSFCTVNIFSRARVYINSATPCMCIFFGRTSSHKQSIYNPWLLSFMCVFVNFYFSSRIMYCSLLVLKRVTYWMNVTVLKRKLGLLSECRFVSARSIHYCDTFILFWINFKCYVYLYGMLK